MSDVKSGCLLRVIVMENSPSTLRSISFNNMRSDMKFSLARYFLFLTHWGRVTHICVSDLITIGSDNGLSPGRRQAIIRPNVGILLIRPLGTNYCDILIEIIIFSFKKMRLKVSSAKRRPFCLGLNVLTETLSSFAAAENCDICQTSHSWSPHFEPRGHICAIRLVHYCFRQWVLPDGRLAIT